MSTKHVYTPCLQNVYIHHVYKTCIYNVYKTSIHTLSAEQGDPLSLKGNRCNHQKCLSAVVLPEQHKLSPNQSAARVNRKQVTSSGSQRSLPGHAAVAVPSGRVLLVTGCAGCHGCSSLGAGDGREVPWGSAVLRPGDSTGWPLL